MLQAIPELQNVTSYDTFMEYIINYGPNDHTHNEKSCGLAAMLHYIDTYVYGNNNDN